MPTLLPIPNRPGRPRRQQPFEQPRQRWDGPQWLAVVLALLGAGVAGWSVATLHAALVLPMLSVTAVAMAIGTGVWAWRRADRTRADRVGYWDIAGALALIGICAALLGDPEQVIPLLEARRAH